MADKTVKTICGSCYKGMDSVPSKNLYKFNRSILSSQGGGGLAMEALLALSVSLITWTAVFWAD